MANEDCRILRELCSSGKIDVAELAIRSYTKKKPDIASYEFVYRCARILAERNNYPTFRVCFLTTFTSRLLEPYLCTNLVLRGFLPKVDFIEYQQWQMALASKSQLDSYAPDLVIALLQLEDVLPYLANRHLSKSDELDQEEELFLNGLRQALEGFRKRSNIPILLGNMLPQGRGLERYFDWNSEQPKQLRINELNAKLSKLGSEYQNVYAYDFVGIVTDIGRSKFFNYSEYFHTGNMINSRVYEEFSNDLVNNLCAFGKRSKAIVVDLDDTFWGGIVGEDGVDAIKTAGDYPGNSYYSFQTFLENLRASGVMLAIASKNNEADVVECFRVRHHDIAVALESFSNLQINWGDKSESIRKISAALDIDMETIVFCDNSPIECGLMRQQNPSVGVIQLDGNPGLFKDKIISSGAFDSIKLTADDSRRADYYLSETKRSKHEKIVGNREDYLAGLGIVLERSTPSKSQMDRVVQLFKRTNQFNLTNKKYDYGEISSFENLGKEIYIFKLSDRFGSYGIISATVIEAEFDSLTIRAFAVSCRALGRGVESAILSSVEERAREIGSERLIGLFRPSTRNSIAQDFYLSHGFVSDGGDRYSRDLIGVSELPTPDYIKIKKI